MNIFGHFRPNFGNTWDCFMANSVLGLCSNESRSQQWRLIYDLHWTGKPCTVTTLSIIVDHLRVSESNWLCSTTAMSWLSGKVETICHPNLLTFTTISFKLSPSSIQYTYACKINYIYVADVATMCTYIKPVLYCAHTYLSGTHSWSLWCMRWLFILKSQNILINNGTFHILIADATFR